MSTLYDHILKLAVEHIRGDRVFELLQTNRDCGASLLIRLRRELFMRSPGTAAASADFRSPCYTGNGAGDPG